MALTRQGTKVCCIQYLFQIAHLEFYDRTFPPALEQVTLFLRPYSSLSRIFSSGRLGQEIMHQLLMNTVLVSSRLDWLFPAA